MNTQQNPYGVWYFTPPSPTFTENGHLFCLCNPARRNIIPGCSVQIDTNWSWWNVQLSSFRTALLQDDSDFHWQLQAMESSSCAQLYWNSCPRQQVQQPLRRRQTLTGIAELSSPLSPSDSRAIDFNYINGAIAKCFFFFTSWESILMYRCERRLFFDSSNSISLLFGSCPAPSFSFSSLIAAVSFLFSFVRYEITRRSWWWCGGTRSRKEGNEREALYAGRLYMQENWQPNKAAESESERRIRSDVYVITGRCCCAIWNETHTQHWFTLWQANFVVVLFQIFLLFPFLSM